MRIRTFIILSLSILLTLTACTGARVVRIPGHSLKPDFIYPTGILQVASVGEVMTSSAPLIIHKTIFLKTQLEATTSNRGKPLLVTAKIGSYELVAENSDGQFYESRNEPVSVNGRNVTGGVYISTNKITGNTLYWAWHKSFNEMITGSVYIAPLNELPEITKLKTRQEMGKDGFVATLSYTGMANGQIKFVYREYMDGLARDAFTQNVSLDYVANSIYAYRNARLLVHTADAIQISYILQKPL